MRHRTTRTPGNRRLRGPRGQHLLDVKVRAATAKRQRRQFINGVVWKILLVAVLCVTGWLGATTALEKFFYQNPEYTLRRVTLETDGILSREDALRETGLREGENIFRVNLSAVDRALRAIPQVAEVVIERRLPDTIAITLRSRRAVAWVAPAARDADPFDPENALLVDETGFLMKPRQVRPEFYSLPVIYGVQSENIRDGEPLHNEDLRRALALLDEVVRNPSTLLIVRSLDISKGYCIEVVSDRNARITFAPDDFQGQLARLSQLLEYCRENGRELNTVNLMVRRNTPVTFVMAAAAPQTKASPAKQRKN